MKIALSIFKDSISTVFDAADQILILDTNGLKRTMVKIGSADPACHATKLKDQGIDVLICGAISRPLQASIAALGITVHPFVRGPVEEIIAAYQNGRLGSVVFAMPGCRGRGFGAGRESKQGQGRGMRCRWR